MKKDGTISGPTPFQRFTEFAKRVISVPKAEVDEQAKKYRQRRQRKKHQARPSRSREK